MINSEEYIEWLKATVKLLNKYNLNNIDVRIKSMHPFDHQINKIIAKDMLHIKIKDVHDILVDDTTYDILY